MLWWDGSLQLRVLRLGLLQDGDVGVGVFPEGEEILIRDACFCRVTHEFVAARLANKGKGNNWVVGTKAVQITDTLKFVCSLLPLAGFKVGGRAHIERKCIGG